jgi:hypothetical protein
VQQLVGRQAQSLDEAGMHDTLDGHRIGRVLGEHLQRIQIFGLTSSHAEHSSEFEQIEIILPDEVKEAVVWQRAVA